MTARPFRAMHWADDMPPIRNEKGHVDHLAHRVLAHLARRAHNDTLVAWPAVQTMARGFGVERREVRRALEALEKLSLIVDHGESDSGTTMWKLAVDEHDPVERLAMLEDQRRTAQARANAARQAKHRNRRNSEESVTPIPDSLTCTSNGEEPVTPPERPESRNSEEGVMSQRGARYVTAESSLRNAASDPRTTKDQLPTSQLPTSELPIADSPDPTPKESRPVLRNFNGYRKPSAEPAEPLAVKKPRSRPVDRNYTPEFEAAWAAYGRKGGKTSSFKAWKSALERTTVEVIMAAIPNYLASAKPRAGYTRDFSTWLNDDGWESESAQPPKSGYQGGAGSDRATAQEYEDATKRLTIPQMMKNSPFVLDRQGCYAWYFHWNRDQAAWSEQQLADYGNTAEDAAVLHRAFREGPPQAWKDKLTDMDIEVDY